MREAVGTRRQFLATAGGLGAGLVVAGFGGARAQDADRGGEKKGAPAEVTPTEDLMREHGVLNRVLLVYD
jgi:hypothetical protein